MHPCVGVDVSKHYLDCDLRRRRSGRAPPQHTGGHSPSSRTSAPARADSHRRRVHRGLRTAARDRTARGRSARRACESLAGTPLRRGSGPAREDRPHRCPAPGVVRRAREAREAPAAGPESPPNGRSRGAASAADRDRGGRKESSRECSRLASQRHHELRRRRRTADRQARCQSRCRDCTRPRAERDERNPAKHSLGGTRCRAHADRRPARARRFSRDGRSPRWWDSHRMPATVVARAACGRSEAVGPGRGRPSTSRP